MSSHNEYSHHHRKPFILFRPFLAILQVFSWMWNDIKPRHVGPRYHHHRSFLRRLWDNITSPFRSMADDLFHKRSSSDPFHDDRSFFRRIWDGLTAPFRWMADDLKHRPGDDSIGEEVKLEVSNLFSAILDDLKVKVNRETLAQAMYLLLIVIVAIRIIAVWKTAGINGVDPFYTYRHIVFTIVWTVLMFFFFNLYLLRKTVSPLIQNLKEMERASFMAFIACLIKFATSAGYIFVNRIMVMAFNWATAYYLGELVIWLMLSVFLYNYWRNRRQIRIREQMGNFES